MELDPYYQQSEQHGNASEISAFLLLQTAARHSARPLVQSSHCVVRHVFEPHQARMPKTIRGLNGFSFALKSIHCFLDASLNPPQPGEETVTLAKGGANGADAPPMGVADDSSLQVES